MRGVLAVRSTRRGASPPSRNLPLGIVAPAKPALESGPHAPGSKDHSGPIPILITLPRDRCSASSAGFARATDSWGRLRRGPPRPPPIERRRWALIIALGLDDPLGGQDLALEDPHLDADGAKRRVCLRQPAVDVGADRMHRNPPL